MSERRQYYRKPFRAAGFVMRQAGTSELRIQDLSLDGFGGYFKGDPALETGNVVHVSLPALQLEGWAMLTRLIPAEKGRYYAGFHFYPSGLHPVSQLLA